VARRQHVGAAEVVALVQERQASQLSQGVGRAVREVELGRVARALAEPAVGVERRARLGGVERDDLDAAVGEVVLEHGKVAAAETHPEDDPGLVGRHGGDEARLGRDERRRVAWAVVLRQDGGRERGGVGDDQSKQPRSL
jgi:hypothetical protein